MIDLSILQRLPEWMHVRDADLRLTWATDHACQTFGWGAVNDGPLELGDLEHVQTAFDAARDQGQWSGRVERTDVNDNLRQLDSRWSAITDPSGSLTGFFIVEQDLSDRPVGDEQLIHAQRMDSIGTLAGGVAHDINNVLGPIILGAEMIRRKVDDPWILKKIEGIESSARRGADIVGQLLDFSRGVEGEKIPVQIRHVMKELVEFAQHTFSKQISVEGSFPRELPLILGDASQVRQAVLNLMVNSRDAMSEGGSLSIDMKGLTLNANQAAGLSTDGQAGDYVAISITDTGDGIPEEIKDRIFEPFFSTRGRGQNSGLGLSTALTIVRGHDGFMTVTSQPGEGSCFTIYLPQTNVPATSVESAGADDSAQETTASYSILVVDDEPMMLEMNADMLNSFGHRTKTASNGKEGLDLFLENPSDVDLIITDINMPVMDGPTMIAQMQQTRPDIPVIAVSGLSEEDHARDGTGLKGVGILHKPYSTGQLLAAIADKMGDPVTNQDERGTSAGQSTGTNEADQHSGDTLSDSDFDELMGGDW